MADVELVIKIDERTYDDLVKYSVLNYTNTNEIIEKIKDGIPLPKRHGRLIDADAIKPKFCNSNAYFKYGEKGFWYYSVKDVNDTPTIIEADVPKRRKGMPLEENDSGYNCENWIP